MSGDGPDLSICIVNWNRREHLRQCLASVLRSTEGLNAEVIVADNASTDGSQEMIRSQFPQVHLIQNEHNLLYAAACNLAARTANGRHLLFLNNDTVVNGPALHRMVRLLDEDPEVGICGPLLERPDGRPEYPYERFPTLPWQLAKLCGLASLASLRLRGGSSSQPVDIVLGSCLMIRGDLARRLGFFDEEFPFYYEEVDLCYRARQAGYSVVFTSDCAVVHHHAQSSGAMPEAERLRHLHAGYARFVAKHRSPGRARLLWALFRLTLARKLVGYGLLTALSLGLSSKVRAKLRQAWLSLSVSRRLFQNARAALTGRQASASPRS